MPPQKRHLKKDRSVAKDGQRGNPSGPEAHRHDGKRETIESIAVALILAFLFRTFEAEAFVIPTGSMAPTLFGRHKDVECDQCKFHFHIGASDEVDNDGYLVSRVRTAVCPNCLYEMPADRILDLPVYKGDRILVNKFPYEFYEPERFDVIVFKYPEDPTTNYIKRLVGLPGETIEIRQGDVYAHSESGVRILRKEDPDKQRELQIHVYDNDHPARLLQEAGWPERWLPVRKDHAPDSLAGWSDDRSGWVADLEHRSFSLDPAHTQDGGHRWIRYRHFVPDPSDWKDILEHRLLDPPRPQLITDFCGYNAYTGGRTMGVDFGIYWVGDLTVSCQVDVTTLTQDAELLLELNEGARKYRCSIDVNTGEARLYYPVALDRDEQGAEERVLATAQTALTGTGQYRVRFANVDDRLCLWIDPVGILSSGESTLTAQYEPYGGLSRQPPTESDLIPVGIAARGLGVRVSQLILERDIYYRSEFRHPDDQYLDDDHVAGTIREYDQEYDDFNHDLRRHLSDPVAWFEEYEPHLSANMTGANGRYWRIPFTFTLGDDEYFVMGDNSPRSKDSRLWSNSRRAERRHAVPGSALVGKAFFIYWPHGIPFMNEGRGYPDGGDSSLKNIYPLNRWFYHRVPTGKIDPDGYPTFRVPFYPNVSRMERIR